MSRKSSTFKSSSRGGSSGRSQPSKQQQQQQQPQPFVVPRGVKSFAKPKLVMYRFLDVIKSKHNLLVEMLRYSRAHLQEFIRRYWEDAEMVELIEELRDTSMEDKGRNDQTPEVFSPPETTQAIQDSILLYVSWKCTTEDNNINLGHRATALQKLLHWIILEGIIENKFKVSIPGPYVATFNLIKRQAVPQLILSSVLHKLYGETRLLSKTDQGDLSPLFHYYDLPIQSRHKETYVLMAAKLGVAPADILLVAFSDTECRKAARAGYRVLKIKQHNQLRPRHANITVINDIGELRLLDG